jgi:WD40 repeat protein
VKVETRFADVSAIRLDPGGRRAAVLKLAGIAIWDLARDVTVAELVGHAASPTAVAWTPTGELAVSAALDGTVRIWDPETGVELARYEQGTQVHAVDVSPDGSAMVSSADDGSVVVRAMPRYVPSEDQMAQLLRCRVPYFFFGDRLRPRRRDPSACGFTTSAL